MPKGVYTKTEEHRQRLREAQTGKKYSEESRRKMSLVKKGKKRNSFTEEHRKNISLYHARPHLGKTFSMEHKQKISVALKGKYMGEKSSSWRGGIAYQPYPREFDKELRLKIRKRDNFTCCLCGKTEREELEELNRVLAVNHIDFDKNNCKESNLNTLCVRCNVKINRDREYWTNYFVMA